MTDKRSNWCTLSCWAAFGFIMAYGSTGRRWLFPFIVGLSCVAMLLSLRVGKKWTGIIWGLNVLLWSTRSYLEGFNA